jgi:hypothetical protein
MKMQEKDELNVAGPEWKDGGEIAVRGGLSCDNFAFLPASSQLLFPSVFEMPRGAVKM